MKYFLHIIAASLLWGCASADRTKIELSPGMTKEEVESKMGLPDKSFHAPQDKTSSGKPARESEVWVYCGKEPEDYKNIEVIFGPDGKFEKMKISGYNAAQAAKDAQRRKRQIRENSELLLNQLDTEDYYYPERTTNILDQTRLNLMHMQAEPNDEPAPEDN